MLLIPLPVWTQREQDPIEFEGREEEIYKLNKYAQMSILMKNVLLLSVKMHLAAFS